MGPAGKLLNVRKGDRKIDIMGVARQSAIEKTCLMITFWGGLVETSVPVAGFGMIKNRRNTDHDIQGNEELSQKDELWTQPKIMSGTDGWAAFTARETGKENCHSKSI